MARTLATIPPKNTIFCTKRTVGSGFAPDPTSELRQLPTQNPSCVPAWFSAGKPGQAERGRDELWTVSQANSC